MIPSRNLQRNIRQFAKISDEFLLLAPNRFAVLACKKSRKGRRTGRSTPSFCVLGTLNEPSSEIGRFSIPELASGRLESLPLSSVPDFDALRSNEAVLRFSLNAEDVRSLQIAARLLKSTHCGVVADSGKAKVKAFCRDTSNDHWFDPWHFKRGNRVYKRRKGGKPVPALSRDSRNSFEQKIGGQVSGSFSGAFEINALRALRCEDHDVTIDAKGVVEMIGVDSGLVFLIPAALV